MKLNKKAQWVRMQMRQRRSTERQNRVEITKELYQQGYSKEEIAINLGVSSSTVSNYIKEAKAIIEYEEIEQKRLNEIKRIEEDKQKYLDNLNNKIDETHLEIDSLKNNLNENENTKKYSNKLVKMIELRIEQLKFYLSNDYDINVVSKFKREVQKLIFLTKNILFSSIVSSLENSFNLESNKSKIPEEEINLFNLKFKKYILLANKTKLNEKDYLEFKELVKELDSSKEIENLSEILENIEKQFVFDNVKKIDEIYEINKDLIAKLGKDLDTADSVIIGVLQFFFGLLGVDIYIRKVIMKQ